MSKRFKVSEMLKIAKALCAVDKMVREYALTKTNREVLFDMRISFIGTDNAGYIPSITIEDTDRIGLCNITWTSYWPSAVRIGCEHQAINDWLAFANREANENYLKPPERAFYEAGVKLARRLRNLRMPYCLTRDEVNSLVGILLSNVKVSARLIKYQVTGLGIGLY